MWEGPKASPKPLNFECQLFMVCFRDDTKCLSFLCCQCSTKIQIAGPVFYALRPAVTWKVPQSKRRHAWRHVSFCNPRCYCLVAVMVPSVAVTAPVIVVTIVAPLAIITVVAAVVVVAAIIVVATVVVTPIVVASVIPVNIDIVVPVTILVAVAARSLGCGQSRAACY
jgi:hypothetical protein